MPNRTLTKDQLRLADQLLEDVRAKLVGLSGSDRELLFAYRRRIFKMLTYDERSPPMARRKLKLQKRAEQNELCAICSEALPVKNAVLDRFHAVDGYVSENTRLICESCDRRVQQERGYA